MKAAAMTAPPLQLNYYLLHSFTLENKLEASEGMLADPRQINLETHHISASGRPEANPADELDWRITLQLATAKKYAHELPWSFELTAMGYFTVSPGFRQDKDFIDKLTTNGLSMLYGMARQYCFQATAMSPYGNAFLPSVSFQPSPAAKPKAKAKSQAGAKTASKRAHSRKEA